MNVRRLNGLFERRCLGLLAVFVTVIAQLGLISAAAAERTVPVPHIVIYPGDKIDNSMLEEREFPFDLALEGRFAESRASLTGKLARRTLLPGQPIPLGAVDNPKLVTIGSQVKIVFIENGLVIVAFGMAMQAGGVGELIRVRNQDSGLTISGRVQPDGSIRVNEG